jgi:hypothetical protein
MVVVMKKMFLLLFVLFAFSMVSAETITTNGPFVAPQSNHSFSSLLLNVYEDGDFLLQGSFSVVPGSPMTRIYFLGPNEDLEVRDSSLPVFFDEKGYFFYTNESLEISVSGSLVYEQKTTISFPSPVMKLEVITPRYTDTFYSVISKQVTISKYEYRPSEQRVTPTYNIFLEKFGTTSFSYFLDLQNPGQELRVSLKNNEKVNSVEGARYKIVGDELILYPETSSRIRIYGSFSGGLGSFSPGMVVPGYVSIQYPSEFEVMVETNALEVDQSEVPGVDSRYNNKMTYEVYSNTVLTISFKELDTYPSLVFAVDDVENKISISENGVILQNTRFSFSNTGLEYASFDVEDLEPLYASINGQASFLTKKNDKIYLAVPKRSYQNAEFITLDKKPELFLGGLINLEVPRVEYPISTFRNTIYYPSNYDVLYSTAGTGFAWESFLFVTIVLTLFLYVVVPGKSKTRLLTSLIFALAIYFLSQVSSLFLFFAVAAYGFAVYKKYKDAIKVEKKVWAILIVAGVGIVVVLALLVIGGTLVGGLLMSTSYQSAGGRSIESDSIAKAPMEEAMGVSNVAYSSEEIGLVTQKEILPVKLDLPMYSNSISLTDHMVTQDKPLKVTLLLVHSWVVKALYLVAGLLLFGVAWKHAKKAKKFKQ